MTTTLDPAAHHAVLINTFQVAPEKADALVDLLARATDETMRARPGFVSANLHVSEDRTRVVNYAQWRSKADFEAMRADPQAQAHMKAAGALAEGFDPVFYELRSSHDA